MNGLIKITIHSTTVFVVRGKETKLPTTTVLVVCNESHVDAIEIVDGIYAVPKESTGQYKFFFTTEEINEVITKLEETITMKTTIEFVDKTLDYGPVVL